MRILYFSPINWDDLKQRPQHIAEELSKHHEVYYIEPSISIVSSIKKRNLDFRKRSYKVNNNLTVFRLSGALRLPRKIDLYLPFGMNLFSERLQIKRLLEECDLIWVGSPIYYPLLPAKHYRPIIYDKMDDHIYMITDSLLKQVMMVYEESLLSLANLIFVTSESLLSDNIKSRMKYFIINNAIDDSSLLINNTNHIITSINNLKRQNKKVFGYVGAIDHWFDFSVIESIIESNENYHVVLVGRDNMDISKSIKFSLVQNISYYPPIPKEEVFNVIRSFDYCLYPFKINEFLDTINPVKLYEYLACNKLIIAALSRETERYVDYLFTYKNSNDLQHILNDTVLESRGEPFKSKDKLNTFISKNTWSHRVKLIEKILYEEI